MDVANFTTENRDESNLDSGIVKEKQVTRVQIISDVLIMPGLASRNTSPGKEIDDETVDNESGFTTKSNSNTEENNCLNLEASESNSYDDDDDTTSNGEVDYERNAVEIKKNKFKEKQKIIDNNSDEIGKTSETNVTKYIETIENEGLNIDFHHMCADSSNDELNYKPNGMELKKKRFKQRLKIVDSDSDENEQTINVQTVENDNDGDKELHHTNIDLSNNAVDYKSDAIRVKKKKLKDRLIILDSDSDENEEIREMRKTKNEEVTESDDDINIDLHRKRVAALCDSDESDGEYIPEKPPVDTNCKIIGKSKSKKKMSLDEPPVHKMTVKQAMQQRQEIRSESLRMLRESRVSLPYHKPKSYSIVEFLQKRPKLNIVNELGNGVNASVAIKMLNQQLEIVTKKMEEREEKLQEFYKSESEDDADDMINNTPPGSPVNSNTHLITTEIVNHDEQVLIKQTISDCLEDCLKQAFDNIQSGSSTANVDTNLNDFNEEMEICVNDKDDNLNTLEKLSENNNYEDASNSLFNTNANNNDLTLRNYQISVEDEYLDKLIEKYPTVSNKKLSREEILKECDIVTPCLSGGPDQDIDLYEGKTKPNAISQLMKRFMQHAYIKNVVKSKVELDVVNLTQGEIHKETVAMSVDPEEEPPIFEKPGMRLQKLRNELQTQIAHRRQTMWLQKTQPLNDESKNKENCDDEIKSVTDGETDEEDMLDDEEEAELTDDESSDNDSYNEKELEHKEKKSNSEFVDDEAEESDIECDETPRSDPETDEEEVADQTETICSETPRRLRRIITNFSDNSNDGSDDGEEILPPNQPNTDKTPHKEPTENRDLSFLSPIQCLTGLQGFNSGSKFLEERTLISPLVLLNDPSPLKEVNGRNNIQKNLFLNSCDFLDSHANTQKASNWDSDGCSTEISDDFLQKHLNTTVNLNTQDVLGICSGNFPNATQDKLEMDSKSLTNEKSSFLSRVTVPTQSNENKETKELDDDKLISQLLDEEELQSFKKKFESPITEIKITNNNMKILSDSSDEESNNEISQRKRKKKKKSQKKLAFSDDESSPGEFEDDDVIDLHDEMSIETAQEVDYDSEENEVTATENHETQNKIRLNEFLESEAELSESDWNSEDEDEKGLDEFEAELGDADVFDEKKMKTDLEKIHMRQVLDDDNREIKILQELLLEDGELHGTGRQRQFRWRNADNSMNEEKDKETEAESYFDEDESEEQWRKSRYQREQFLKSKQEKKDMVEDDILEISSVNQVLTLGQTVVQKNLSNATLTVEKTQILANEAPTPLLLKNTRGSFLARNNRFLTRLAEFAKTNTSTSTTISKTSKKIVFHTISSDTEDVEVGIKRKSDNKDGTPKLIKKLRLSSNLTPESKNVNRKKKLF